jgi:hypothetical protein
MGAIECRTGNGGLECQSARVPAPIGALRLLIHLAMEGSPFDAYSQPELIVGGGRIPPDN